ncbi:MAG: hypothetical protein K0U10_03645, partial [Gammaproteobacteria bacterium]|nr:hypothetical protein [Gammaproteobacteria bacterium]
RVVRCNELQPVVIILSPDTFNQSIGENVEPMIDFYKWAKMSGLCVVIRLNPKGSAEKQFALKSYFPDAILDDSTVSLNMSYEKWKPKMVFSWRSTGLAIALQYGFLPVSCFTRTDKKRPLGRAIYPLADCVLFWPEEKALMQNAIGDSAMYNTTILRLQQPLAILPETAESP